MRARRRSTSSSRWPITASGAADGRRPPVQHRRAAPDRPLRDGRADVRAPGARGQADHRLRRRHAAALLLPRHGRRPGARRPDGERGHYGEVFNIGSTEEISILGARRAGHGRLTGSASRDRDDPLRRGLRGRVSRTCSGRVPDTTKIEHAIGWRQTHRPRRDPRQTCIAASARAGPGTGRSRRGTRRVSRSSSQAAGASSAPTSRRDLLDAGLRRSRAGQLRHRAPLEPRVLGGDVDVVEGDIQSYERANKAVAGCEVVFHQAALPSVPRSIQDPLTSNATNVTGTLNVLLAARDHGVRRVVYASSSSVYGANPALPKREDDADGADLALRDRQAGRARATAAASTASTGSRPSRSATSTCSVRARIPTRSTRR